MNPCHAIPRESDAGRAFTLVELLTVIAIVGILVAITVPVVGHVRATAKAALCASNLRQIGQAAQLWSNDNHGLVVPVFNPDDNEGSNWLVLTTWVGLLAPYVGWQAPKNANAFPSVASAPAIFVCPEHPSVFGYGYNYYYLSWNGQGYNRWVRYNQVPNPAQTLMIVDSIYNANKSQWRAYVRVPFTGITDSVINYCHPGGTANVLWLDGHVSAVKNDGTLNGSTYWGIHIPRTAVPTTP